MTCIVEEKTKRCACVNDNLCGYILNQTMCLGKREKKSSSRTGCFAERIGSRICCHQGAVCLCAFCFVSSYINVQDVQFVTGALPWRSKEEETSSTSQ